MAFNFVPTGTLLSFAANTAPSGWLICDGSAVSRTSFAALYAVIGVSWGYGDNSTTFNLPDLRGRFPRGRDTGIARDPDRASRIAANTGGNTGDNVGSVQSHGINAHQHRVFDGTTGVGSINRLITPLLVKRIMAMDLEL
jgi:microcystin-dependent protein